MVEDAASHPRSLADKLDQLFRTIHPPDQAEYTYEEVAQALRKLRGPTISATYVWQLRKGLRDNPTKRHLEALSEFFGVPVAYFFDDNEAARIDTELKLVVALRDSAVRELAVRAVGLSAGSLTAIRGMIEQVRLLEGLNREHGGGKSGNAEEQSVASSHDR
jgi:transcriptional regulator with XRE-family HTH domain